MSTAPILIFDSGVGGLTVLTELRKILPDAPVIFAADQAGLPYGAKSEAEIAARVAGLLGRMSERYRPRLACIACNTASTIALEMVREVLEIPIVGTVPAIKPAAAMTKSGVIGLLGTEATIRQGYVDRLEAKFAQDKTLLRHGAPGLVRAAEAKLRGEAIDPDVIASAVSALRSQAGGERIDTVVLACTHFPLLADELGAAFGPDVALIDGAQGIARRIVALCEGQQFDSQTPSMAVTTGPPEQFRSLAPLFAANNIDHLDQF
ncbi:glutamate racemase [Pontixanthobacter aquaemixtae]|uniref:Glutamate racemase n=1 Tax=Pontixanthobacter aquaemixtae TaxID=1958940 RepID=A0A844ZQ91_9SPHN|nr:glutamate racemase [Pontixanthobacter aquaemixtae]MXO90025.1 glutamate racemase [Pontixanthobacter aquaemixtae]